MTRNNQRTIPSDQPKSVATYKLLSDGEALSRTYHVLSLVVNHEANRIPSARVVLLDGEPAQESFAISNTADFEPGRAIEIHLGYRSDERRVFSGIVVCHAIKVRAQGSVLIVDCKDVAERMTVASKSRYFRDVKDSDVIESLLGEHELDADVAATSVTHGQLVQYSSTDWDMLVCRAEASGMLVLAQDGKVTCKKPALSGDAVLTVQYGATVHELDAEVDARLQSPGVTAAFWDPAEQAIDQSVEAAEPQLPAASDLSAAQLADVTARAPLSLVHAGAAAVAEAQAWADASLLRQRLAKVRGRVTIDGTAAVSVDSIIRLNGQRAHGG